MKLFKLYVSFWATTLQPSKSPTIDYFYVYSGSETNHACDDYGESKPTEEICQYLALNEHKLNATHFSTLNSEDLPTGCYLVLSDEDVNSRLVYFNLDPNGNDTNIYDSWIHICMYNSGMQYSFLYIL